MRYAILGNMSALLMICIALAGATPDCSLEVRNADGAVISVVGAGVPFQVVVSVHECAEHPQVTFDESSFASIRRVSVQTRTVNGHTSVSYIYYARIDRMGLYDIGPARVVVAGTSYETNKETIEVGQQTKTTGSRLMMQVSLDETDLYVGQETMMRIHILSATSAPEVESLHVARVDGITIGEFTQTDSGTKTQDGIKYRYKEFSAPFYAESAGNFVIPACSADIRDDQIRHSGFFFFTTIAPTKQVYSNAVSCTVKNIPHTTKPYALIGEYTKVEASVEPALVELGQAVRYRLTIYGDGNMAQAKAPLLAEVPTSCKYYDSSVTPLPNHKGVIFEYVIQPRQAGTWEIPSQEIIYFNPTQKKFCTLASEPVTITAHRAVASSEDDTSSSPTQENDTQPSVMTAVQQYHPDLFSAEPIPSKIWTIPWFWYWIMVALLWLAVGGSIVGTSIYALYAQNTPLYKKRMAFYKARKALSTREQNRSRITLHQIFVTLFAEWFMVPKSAVTESFIKDKIQKTGILSDDGAESWQRFWHTIVQEQYGTIRERTMNKTVYTEARLWITAFSKCVVQ